MTSALVGFTSTCFPFTLTSCSTAQKIRAISYLYTTSPSSSSLRSLSILSASCQAVPSQRRSYSLEHRRSHDTTYQDPSRSAPICHIPLSGGSQITSSCCSPSAIHDNERPPTTSKLLKLKPTPLFLLFRCFARGAVLANLSLP